MVESRFPRKNRKVVVSSEMVKSITPYRRATLEEELERAGLFSSGSSSPEGMTKTALGNVISNVDPFKKTASPDWRGSGGTVRQQPEIYSPLWLHSNLNLPRDRATINSWCRAFYALNPIVHNALNLHSTYPISKLNITCKDEKVLAFFEEMNEDIDLLNRCVEIALEFFLLGESFPYAELDENSGKWSRIIIQNPDYIIVKHSVVAGEPLLSLRPDENLKRMVTSNRPSDMMQRQKLDPAILEHIKKGENIPLPNFYASHIARKINPYDVRGTGLPVSCFKQLMLYDQLRESKYVQATDLVNPLTLIKVGSADHNPNEIDLEHYRRIFEESAGDKNFKIFTHQDVVVDRVGANGAIIDINPDIQELRKELYVGLMVPQVLMDGGGDVTYANAGITLDVLKQRYIQFRNMLAHWIRKKIFAPISKIQSFYEKKDGKKILIVPNVEWNHMSLFDAGDYIQSLTALRQGESKDVSLHTLFRSLGIDYEEEQRRKKTEAIQAAIAKKEELALEQMTLEELRTLKPDDPIEEPKQDALPGEKLPGQEPEAEMDLGGEPSPVSMPSPSALVPPPPT